MNYNNNKIINDNNTVHYNIKFGYRCYSKFVQLEYTKTRHPEERERRRRRFYAFRVGRSDRGGCQMFLRVHRFRFRSYYR